MCVFMSCVFVLPSFVMFQGWALHLIGRSCGWNSKGLRVLILDGRLVWHYFWGFCGQRIPIFAVFLFSKSNPGRIE
jgi:hypothetical protein